LFLKTQKLFLALVLVVLLSFSNLLLVACGSQSGATDEPLSGYQETSRSLPSDITAITSLSVLEDGTLLLVGR